MDTARNENKNECVVVTVNNSNLYVELTEIAKLEVLDENPQFTEVIFKNNE